MRYCVPFLILVGAPSCAFALEKEGGFSFIASFVQMLASLALVIGLIYLFYYVSNRWLKKGGSAKGRSRLITVVETCYFAPKKSFLLVEVGGEYLLLSDCGDGVRFIKEVVMPGTNQHQAETLGKEAGHGMSRL